MKGLPSGTSPLHIELSFEDENELEGAVVSVDMKDDHCAVIEFTDAFGECLYTVET